MSLMPSIGTHLLHLWHLPSSICDRSVFAAFGRGLVRNATGGENGRAVTAEIPADSQKVNMNEKRKGDNDTMYVLHVIATTEVNTQ
jgi:hypothetical protein